jgi:SAM-dependent methyltransferase
MKSGTRSEAAIRQQYEVEVELADRLRSATSEERLAGLYSAVYGERLARVPTHPLLTKSRDPSARMRATQHQLRLLRPLLAPSSVFLEIGPGDCALSVAVAATAKQVYAVDVSDALLGGVRRPGNFRLLLSNGRDVPVPAGSVDLAYSNQVLEHLHPQDAEAQIAAVYAALKPGGNFICITPNRLSGPWDVSRRFTSVSTGLHLREYSVTEVVDLLSGAGFEVRLFASYHGFRLLPYVPTGLVRTFEACLQPLPTSVRRPLASPLVAVKVIGTKPPSQAPVSR